jgi:CRISPR-associated protein Csd1
MILQTLKEYYDRKAADPDSGIAPVGWEKKEIPFIIVIGRDGNFIQLEDTREGDGKKKRARSFIVPQGVKKTSGVAANLLWDVAGYVFGIDNKGKPERAQQQKNAFIAKIVTIFEDCDDIKPLIGFLNSIPLGKLQEDRNWSEIIEIDPVLTFRYVGENELICQKECVRNVINGKNSGVTSAVCLVTGEQDTVATLHSAIKGVYGAQTAGANIVSFNLSAFQSFNKIQGYNSPVGEQAAFAYVTALNTLLSRDSRQRISIGDTSTVFWSAKETEFETDFSYFFSEPPKDDPDSGTQKIKALYDGVNNGHYYTDNSDTKFYVLGLAPNAARIAIRFWQVGTVTEFAEKIKQHFDDLAITKPEKEIEFYSVWRLLVNIAPQDKSENIPPNIAGDFIRAILTGAPYPATLLQAALRRIHSDTDFRVKPVRAALIKAYLNRYYRIHINPNHKEIQMSLDTSQPSKGYQLGRLFAALEKIQEEANPGLNATIRERYYGSACASPVTVFSNLLRLKNHHLAKMENKGRVVNFERLLSEIISNLEDFPAHLDLHEQGKFAVGYYHQRQDFFTKKETIQGNN